MFVGEYEYKIDNKGRLPLPPKFRKEIEDGLFLTMIADNCITAFTKADWTKLTANQAPTGLFMTDKERQLNRFIFGNAHDVVIDNQGRIALPAILREKCGLTDTVIVAGNNNSFEIWNPVQRGKIMLTPDEARQLMNTIEGKK
jgi:MraZ protein